MGESSSPLPRRSPGAALPELSVPGSGRAGPPGPPAPAGPRVPTGPSRPDGGRQAGIGGTAERFRAFTDTVLALHRVTPAVPGPFPRPRGRGPMCSCGLPARCCDIVRAEHEVLGIAMPFAFGPLRTFHREVSG